MSRPAEPTREPVHHLALLQREYIRLILSGDKRTEVRLTKNRVAPFGQINRGDIVYLKAVSGEVEGIAHVAGVRQFEKLTPRDVRAIAREFGEDACAPSEFWAARSDASYGVLIALDAVEQTRDTVYEWRSAIPAGSRSGWHVLDGPLDPELAAIALDPFRPTG